MLSDVACVATTAITLQSSISRSSDIPAADLAAEMCNRCEIRLLRRPSVRHRSLQYFTVSQDFSHDLRHVICCPQVQHTLALFICPRSHTMNSAAGIASAGSLLRALAGLRPIYQDDRRGRSPIGFQGTPRKIISPHKQSAAHVRYMLWGRASRDRIHD